jgi:hypothetical protein
MMRVRRHFKSGEGRDELERLESHPLPSRPELFYDRYNRIAVIADCSNACFS